MTDGGGKMELFRQRLGGLLGEGRQCEAGQPRAGFDRLFALMPAQAGNAATGRYAEGGSKVEGGAHPLSRAQ